MREVTAIFLPSGEVKIETMGFVGPACEAVTKSVEEMLGTKVSGQKKPEYYQTIINKQTT